jgi:hypothetical protein
LRILWSANDRRAASHIVPVDQISPRKPKTGVNGCCVMLVSSGSVSGLGDQSIATRDKNLSFLQKKSTKK